MKKGMLIKVGQDLFRVLELQHVTPGNLRGFVRVKFRNIRTGTLSDQKLRSEDFVERATLDEREMQYLYRDGDAFHFMDTSSYEQVQLTPELVGDGAHYLIDGLMVDVLFVSGRPVGCTPPTFVELKVIQTDPGFKGDTSGNTTKAAIVETGLEVQVPLFISEGETLRIDTRTGAYCERVKR